VISNSFFKNPHKRIHFELVSHLRHLKNFLTVCLSVRGFTRYAIRETFALDTLKRNCRTFPVRHLAGVPFEIPFREIARQMSFTKLADAAALPPQCGGNSVRQRGGGCFGREHREPTSPNAKAAKHNPLRVAALVMSGENALNAVWRDHRGPGGRENEGFEADGRACEGGGKRRTFRRVRAADARRAEQR
jgi:hypothetical protein